MRPASRLLPPPRNAEDSYPSSDGAPMAETQVHVALIAGLYSLLEHHFRKWDDVLVAANIFLYWRKGSPACRKAPDLMVIKGVDGRSKRRSFKVWEEKAVPCFVLEITSKRTAREDREGKKRLYRRLGVREYFLYDPLHEYLDPPLCGYRIFDGKYRAVDPDADGGLVSQELGLRFLPAGEKLTVVEDASGVKLLDHDELHARLAELEAELKKLRRGKKSS